MKNTGENENGIASQENMASFAHYQVSSYQKKIKALEEEIKNLIAIGKENERIWEGTCQLTEELLKNQAGINFFDAAEQGIGRYFHLSLVAIRILGKHASSSHPAIPEKFILNAPEEKKVLALWEDSLSPLCGKVETLPVEWLFLPLSFSKGSSAIVPLTDGEEVLGMLVLGSQDTEKFFSGMGTVFLTFLGRILSHLISLRLGKA
ncbi:MAG: DUF484 family protein [Gammaproteobacteria bacterium]|nr:DUF484 family protein [Gammaproteobacteria bacterium]